MSDWSTLLVFALVLGGVSLLGFASARWRPGDLNRLQEWALAGRRFGTITSWFLMGGVLYTTFGLIALPAYMLATGAPAYFAVPYATLIYPIMFIFLPRFWIVARHRGYVTPSDFVRERFDSRLLALLIAIAGILATIAYIALQLFGIEVVLAQMGLPVEASLTIAFVVLAGYTYFGGLRAPALMAIVKDILVCIVLVAALTYIPMQLGGYDKIFAAIPQKKVILSPGQYSAYATLALGSAFALFLLPHNLLGISSANSAKVVKRNAFLLPFYSLCLGASAILGYMALAAKIPPSPLYGYNSAFPALIARMFPGWFAGLAFGTICVSALVPSAIMSIAAANLFTRNIYREYFRTSCGEREEARVARLSSLVVKAGALGLLLFLPTTFAVNLQLLGNIWILQTLPAVMIGLYTRWFHRSALIIGWIAGMLVSTAMTVAAQFGSIYVLHFADLVFPIYSGLAGLIVNLFLSVVCTPIFRSLAVTAGSDAINPADFETHPILPVSINSPLSVPSAAPQATIVQGMSRSIPGERIRTR